MPGCRVAALKVETRSCRPLLLPQFICGVLLGGHIEVLIDLSTLFKFQFQLHAFLDE